MELANVGNLSLWPDGAKDEHFTAQSRFNRLAVMISNKSSWHRVASVAVDEPSCCGSNYYFFESLAGALATTSK